MSESRVFDLLRGVSYRPNVLAVMYNKKFQTNVSGVEFNRLLVLFEYQEHDKEKNFIRITEKAIKEHLGVQVANRVLWSKDILDCIHEDLIQMYGDEKANQIYSKTTKNAPSHAKGFYSSVNKHDDGL